MYIPYICYLYGIENSLALGKQFKAGGTITPSFAETLTRVNIPIHFTGQDKLHQNVMILLIITVAFHSGFVSVSREKKYDRR